MLKIMKAADKGTERIVRENDLRRMISAELDDRCRAALRLLYVCGLRASELCGPCWRDMTAGKQGGEARVNGNGSKIRTVIVPADL